VGPTAGLYTLLVKRNTPCAILASAFILGSRSGSKMCQSPPRRGRDGVYLLLQCLFPGLPFLLCIPVKQQNILPGRVFFPNHTGPLDDIDQVSTSTQKPGIFCKSGCVRPGLMRAALAKFGLQKRNTKLNTKSNG
jgi:hypothetical protein